MRNNLLNDLTQAMKNQDKETLSVLRMVKGAIQLEEINLKHELSDDEFISVVSKQIKTRKESIKDFEKGNRQDLIDKTQEEIDILAIYLPEQLSDSELVAIIDKVFDEVKPTSVKDMGAVMGKVTPLVKGKADMGKVSSIIREKLG